MRAARKSALAADPVELLRRVSALEQMSLEDLRAEWKRVIKTHPHIRFSADLLRRGIAHRLQELEHGGLPAVVVRALASSACATAAADRAAPVLKPGTALIREWHGRTHTVRVLDEGFEFGGERYSSLTAIAREITGAAWSGPRFFGVENAGTAFRSKKGARNA